MTDLTIKCPDCGSTIPLDETFAGPLLAETRRDFESKLAQVAAAEAKKARDGVSGELAEMRRQAAEREAKLADAQKAQADFVRQSRELAERQRELDLTIQNRVSAAMGELRAKARAEADEAAALRLAEKEKTIADMQRQLAEANRRAEQGSQQLQGEVLELQLEALLGARFPTDTFEAVGKGVFGADLIQRVNGSVGQSCGAIIWETKRTKNWTEGWLAKLRTDQRTANAEIAVLLSEALPKGIETFDLVDGVWVAHPRYAEPLGLILRQSLIELETRRVVQAGQESKMELVYNYLTGPGFRHRIEAIVERFTEMQADLVRERTAMQKLWARREQQIGAVVASTVGLFGDFQGIAGQAIGNIPALELPGSDDGT